MKNLLFLILTMLISINVSAQLNESINFGCGSDKIEQELIKDPVYKAEKEAFEKAYVKEMKGKVLSPQKSESSNELYTIPVIIHVVHNGEIPIGEDGNKSDDEIIAIFENGSDRFRHTSGYVYENPNSGVDTEIEFCLATIDPNGNYTSGIIRHFDPYNATRSAYQSIGDLAEIYNWPEDEYMNLYLVQSPGVGGIASTNIVIINGYSFWGGLFAHEVGHYLSLAHIFSSTCDNDDCLLNGDKVCDTPPKNNQGVPDDFDCGVSGSNSCTTDEDDTSINNPYRPVSLGGLGDQNDLIENYMDYTFGMPNPCGWNAFTIGQKERMRFQIENYRMDLVGNTSNVCISQAAPNNDATIVIVTTETESNCIDTFDAQFELANVGSGNLTNANFNVYLNDELIDNFQWTGNLASSETELITLGSNNITQSGLNVLKVEIETVNGSQDENPYNNISGTTFIQNFPTFELFSEDLEEEQPDSWTVNNINDGVSSHANWFYDGRGLFYCTEGEYVNVGVNTAYNASFLVLPSLDLSIYDEATLSFSYGYVARDSDYPDEFRVEIVEACQDTIVLFNESDLQLSTNSPSVYVNNGSGEFTAPSCDEYETVNIDLSSFTGTGAAPFEINFVTEGYFYYTSFVLDNISITGNSICELNNPLVATNTTKLCTNSTATISVSNPTVNNDYQYKWYFNDEEITGELNSSIQVEEAGEYYVSLLNLVNEDCPVLKSEPIVIEDLVLEEATCYDFEDGGLESWSNENTDGVDIIFEEVFNTSCTALGDSIIVLNTYGNTSQLGESKVLLQQYLDLTSYIDANLKFDYAYMMYYCNLGNALEVSVSDDCGVNFSSLYYRDYYSLSTVSGFDAGGAWVPSNCEDWRNVDLSLSSYLGSEIIIKIEVSKNDMPASCSTTFPSYWGQNIYFDNICIDAQTCELLTWYEDADNDGLGNVSISIESCTQPDGYVSNANDNDDTQALCQQTIPLIAGWNLISLDVQPDSRLIADVFSSLQAGNLEYVTGFDNGALVYDPNLPSFLNTLTQVTDGFGYWVKVQNSDLLEVEGSCLDENYRKPLDAGWNLVAYPPGNPQAPNIYFADLITSNDLEYVTGFDNGTLTYDPNLPPFLNTLQQMENGFGYWLKVANSSGKVIQNPSNIFNFINGTSNLPAGERINVISQNGEVITVLEVVQEGYLMTTPIYGDDPLTEAVQENIKVGEKLLFSWNNQTLDVDANFTGDLGIQQVNLVFNDVGDLSTLLSLKVYPVPANDMVNFEFNTSLLGEYVLQVFDISGRLVASIKKTTISTGTQIIDYNVQTLANGIYTYKLIANGEEQAGKFEVIR